MIRTGKLVVNDRAIINETFGESKANKGGSSRSLTFSLSTRNVINHTNLNQPVGNLSSSFFGLSTSLINASNSANRRWDLQPRFAF